MSDTGEGNMQLRILSMMSAQRRGQVQSGVYVSGSGIRWVEGQVVIEIHVCWLTHPL